MLSFRKQRQSPAYRSPGSLRGGATGSGHVTGSWSAVSIMLRFPHAGHLMYFQEPAWIKLSPALYSKTAPHFGHFAVIRNPAEIPLQSRFLTAP